MRLERVVQSNDLHITESSSYNSGPNKVLDHLAIFALRVCFDCSTSAIASIRKVIIQEDSFIAHTAADRDGH